MPSAKLFELGAQSGGIGDRHVGRVEQRSRGSSTARLARGQAPVDGLANNGCNGNPALARSSRNTLVALVIEEDLQPMSIDAHTLA